LHGYLNIRTCDEYTAPKRRLTIQQKQESQEWTYYIAAEEIIWDYAPNMPDNIDGYVCVMVHQQDMILCELHSNISFSIYSTQGFPDKIFKAGGSADR